MLFRVLDSDVQTHHGVVVKNEPAVHFFPLQHLGKPVEIILPHAVKGQAVHMAPEGICLVGFDHDAGKGGCSIDKPLHAKAVQKMKIEFTP